MTEQHVNYIRAALGHIVGATPHWFKSSASKALATANLVERGLTDLNRLADAAEKLASFELTQIGDSVHGRAAPVIPGGSHAAFITDLEHETLDALRDGKARVVLVGQDVAKAIDPWLASSSPKDVVGDYAMWLTTRPAALGVGAKYPVPPMLATVNEYAKLKGWA